MSRFSLLDFGFKELLVALNPIEPDEPNFAWRLLGPIGTYQFSVAFVFFLMYFPFEDLALARSLVRLRQRNLAIHLLGPIGTYQFFLSV